LTRPTARSRIAKPPATAPTLATRDQSFSNESETSPRKTSPSSGTERLKMSSVAE